jgi:glycosyltransferase involved in cell wall biosynthesis
MPDRPHSTAPTRARRARVLMLLDSLDAHVGGGERFAAGLATHLPADRVQVSFCATRGIDEHWSRILSDAGVPHFSLGRRGATDVLAFRRLGGYLRGQGIEILHGHKFGSNVWATVVGRLAGVPIVVGHEQTWSYEGDPVRRFLDGQLIGRFADRFVAVSSADRERMIALEGVPRAKTVLELNGFVPRPRPGTADLRSELGLPADAPIVGTVCMLRRQKALHVLLDAFAQVHAVRPDAHLVIGGDGECRDELEAQARSLGLNGSAHFLGLREDVDAILPAFTVATMSSDYEGTPLFAFECMAARVPLAATDVGGLPDMLEDGTSALLVPRRDPGALAGALRTLLDDSRLRATQAEAAHARLDRYTMDAVAGRFADLYDELLIEKGLR